MPPTSDTAAPRCGLRLALCNEVLARLSFAEQCRVAAQLGYTGLELAPYTLAEDPAALSEADMARHAGIARDHGLAISSLHWLLVQPAGLSIATPDEPLRRRTVDFLKHMVDLARACDAEALVHGSPQQRSPQAGQPVADALARSTQSWHELAPYAAAAGLHYCIEPLAPRATPVVNTVAQAAAIVDVVASPGLRTMLDLSAASASEAVAPAQVLTQYLRSGHIVHVQLNDANRRGPGQGATPVAPVLKALQDAGYAGWIAIEPFEYLPDPIGCAAASAGHVRGAWEALGGVAAVARSFGHSAPG